MARQHRRGTKLLFKSIMRTNPKYYLVEYRAPGRRLWALAGKFQDLDQAKRFAVKETIKRPGEMRIQASNNYGVNIRFP